MGVSAVGWCYLLVISGLLPLLAIRTAFQVRKPGPRPTAQQHLISVAFTQFLSLFLALLALRSDRLELFPRPELGWQEPVVALAFLALTLGTLRRRWRWKPLEERGRNLWLYPRSTPDLVRWAAVSLMAGTVEEVVYRGVLLQLWQRVLGAWWPAMLLSALVFALAHFAQGWRAVLVTVAFAAATHGIVSATGDLYTAMFVHVVYDFLAGVLILRLARADGLLPGEAPAGT
jgi:membrane protease YdiL (CAAX protease family)